LSLKRLLAECEIRNENLLLFFQFSPLSFQLLVLLNVHLKLLCGDLSLVFDVKPQLVIDLLGGDKIFFFHRVRESDRCLVRAFDFVAVMEEFLFARFVFALFNFDAVLNVIDVVFQQRSEERFKRICLLSIEKLLDRAVAFDIQSGLYLDDGTFGSLFLRISRSRRDVVAERRFCVSEDVVNAFVVGLKSHLLESVDRERPSHFLITLKRLVLSGVQIPNYSALVLNLNVNLFGKVGESNLGSLREGLVAIDQRFESTTENRESDDAFDLVERSTLLICQNLLSKEDLDVQNQQRRASSMLMISSTWLWRQYKCSLRSVSHFVIRLFSFANCLCALAFIWRGGGLAKWEGWFERILNRMFESDRFLDIEFVSKFTTLFSQN
jgi:hypothetical protein